MASTRQIIVGGVQIGGAGVHCIRRGRGSCEGRGHPRGGGDDVRALLDGDVSSAAGRRLTSRMSETTLTTTKGL